MAKAAAQERTQTPKRGEEEAMEFRSSTRQIRASHRRGSSSSGSEGSESSDSHILASVRSSAASTTASQKRLPNLYCSRFISIPRSRSNTGSPCSVSRYRRMASSIRPSRRKWSLPAGNDCLQQEVWIEGSRMLEQLRNLDGARGVMVEVKR